jgi:anti-anti-sigma factor
VRSVQDHETLLAGTTVVIACLTGDDLARRLSETEALGAQHVVVDLGETEMLDASTLTAFKRVAERLRSRGGELSVVCVNAELAGLLRTTLLSRSFRVVSSIDAALRTS